MADQQFCLRWNNHQSTLVSVFDSLLERGCLVDCTLAAEGRSLQAHKVVLSACSPFLEELLSQHYDKHPILLLKDVKYEELQAMMDYMYRGEVNVAQDKLGHFLQAAESLQIKGLSDSGGKEPPDPRSSSVPSASKRTVKGIPLNRATPSESRKQVNQEILLDGSSQDGSISPNIRKRRRRGASLADESELNDSTGNAPVSHAPPPAVAPAATPSAPSKESLPLVPGPEASDPSFLTTLLESNQTENNDSNSSSRDHVINQKQEPTSEILLEPKTEYVDDEQDLTMEDDMDNSLYKAGPSGRQSGYDGMQDSTDEIFMAANESGARDAQGSSVSSSAVPGPIIITIQGIRAPCSQKNSSETGTTASQASASGSHTLTLSYASPQVPVKKAARVRNLPGCYVCEKCGKSFKWMPNLRRHLRLECGKEPKHECPHCEYKAKQKSHLKTHMKGRHPEPFDFDL